MQHLYACLLAILCSFYVAKTAREDGIRQNVKEFIQKGLQCHNNPALAISVVKDGEIVFAEGFGLKNISDASSKVTNKTLFGIASLSKAFAATLLMKLLDGNKKFSLSSKVSDVLGKEDLFYGKLRSQYATLEDLLAHRMGVPSNNNIRLDDSLTRENLVGRLKYLKPIGGFRTSFYYNNLMYGLVTYITERLGGRKWEDLVMTELFQPIGMTSSSFVTTVDWDKVDFAVGYLDKDGHLYEVPHEYSRLWGLLCGSGCVLSNALDMAKWMMFHLSGGRNTEGVWVLREGVLGETHAKHQPIPTSTISSYLTRPVAPVTFSEDNYGLGWKIGYYRGYPLLTHTGSTDGYRALLTLYPNQKLGIFTAMTGDDPSYIFRSNLHNYISDLYLHEEPWLNVSTICSFPEPWFEKKNSTPKTTIDKNIQPFRANESYVGVYSNEAYGDIKIYIGENNQLMATYGYARFLLFPKKTSDLFYAEGTGLLKDLKDFTTFRFSDKCNSSSLMNTLEIPSFESQDPPAFTRRKAVTIPISRSNRMANCIAPAYLTVLILLETVIWSTTWIIQ
ncbi:hypothetical protein ACJMK2_000314 [Sinanodonta woodiana]|uniref:Beta-lactamase-related domain-containing protein n=1 Tax=Sinanodonta woodiana TaxID=1069815 RepID=A0ABD3XP14_SINWO